MVVVITGASAGVGRATARAFGRARRRASRLLARGEDGLRGAAREVEAPAGARSSCRPTSPTPTRSRPPPSARGASSAPIDVWVNVAMASVFAPRGEIDPAEFRRVTEVTYLGYVHGTLAALRRMRPRDRGTIVQVGSALAYRGIPLQARLLRRQARDPRVHRLAAHRADARAERGPRHDGPAAGAEHAAVRWSARAAAAAAPGRAGVPARGRGRRDRLGARAPARASSGSAPRPRCDPRQHASRPGIGDRYLARTGVRRPADARPGRRARRRRLPLRPVRGDHGAHGPFADESKARSAQVWLAEHRGVVAAGAGAAVAGALAAAGAAATRR